METLDIIIKKAIKTKACEEEIIKIKRFMNLDDLIKNASDNQKVRWACWYAQNVIRGRWKEAEPYIMKDPEWTYEYAKDVIRGRWPEAEPLIIKEPQWAYRYARDVIRGRWPEAEPIIMKDPNYAYWYAKSVIKGRWLEVD